MKKDLTFNEKVVIERISNIIRRKLIHLGKQRELVCNLEMPITLTELIQYQKGLCQIPLCRLVLLLEFYGCKELEIAQWNVKISALAYRALEHARNENEPPVSQ